MGVDDMTQKKTKTKKVSEFLGMSMDGLLDKKKEVKELLASLEDDYRNAVISEKSYKHTKDVNLKKLEDIKQQLKDFGITDDDGDKEGDTKNKDTSSDKKETSVQPDTNVPTVAVAEDTSTSTESISPTTSDSTEPTPQIATESNDENKTDGDSSLKEHKHSSFMGKLKEHLIPSSTVSSSKGTTTQTNNEGSNNSGGVSTQNVELLMQKFSEKFNVDLERIKANIDSIKETKTSTDERLQNMTEGLSELRTTVFQREAGLKDQEMKFTRVKELVDDIEPEKINKDFMKRDKFMSEMEVRIEKLEIKMEDVIKTVRHTEELLKSIGGLENMAKVNHVVSKKMEHIDERGKAIEHISSKIEKMFVDMNKNLEDFEVYEARQTNMGEILDDTLKNVDQMGVKFNSYIDKKEIVKVREDIDTLSEKIDMLRGIVKKAVPFAEAEIPKELQVLEDKKEDIEGLLSTLEVEHNKKQISDKEYKVIMSKNIEALDKIKAEIGKIMKTIIPKTESMDDKVSASNVKSSTDTSDNSDTITPTNSEGNVKNDTDVDDEDVVAEKDKPEVEADNKDNVDDKDGVDTSDETDKKTENTEKQSNTADDEKDKSIDVAQDNVDDTVKSDSGPKVALEEGVTNKVIDTGTSDVISNTKTDIATNTTDTNTTDNTTDNTDMLFEELEDSFAQGIISKETYEKTKKLLTG